MYPELIYVPSSCNNKYFVLLRVSGINSYLQEKTKIFPMQGECEKEIILVDVKTYYHHSSHTCNVFT